MQELISKLMAIGLTEDQSIKAIGIIRDFAKEKFPIFSSAIDKLFSKYNVKKDDDFME